MKNLQDIIIEKLKINKDIKISSISLEEICNKYKLQITKPKTVCNHDPKLSIIEISSQQDNNNIVKYLLSGTHESKPELLYKYLNENMDLGVFNSSACLKIEKYFNDCPIKLYCPEDNKMYFAISFYERYREIVIHLNNDNDIDYELCAALIIQYVYLVYLDKLQNK